MNEIKSLNNLKIEINRLDDYLLKQVMDKTEKAVEIISLIKKIKEKYNIASAKISQYLDFIDADTVIDYLKETKIIWKLLENLWVICDDYQKL